jgi:hypothetical protein
MAAITPIIYEMDTGLSLESNAPFQVKEIIAITPNTADPGDTFTVTLAYYGISTLAFIKGQVESPEGSGNFLLETPTTSVTTGVLTVTINNEGSGIDSNLSRRYLIGGY